MSMLLRFLGGLALSILLAACSTSLTQPAEGWWSEVRPARPKRPADSVLTWAARRPLAQDTLVHTFIRELLAQARTSPGGDSLTTFYLGTTLFDQTPVVRTATYSSDNSPNISGGLFRALVTRSILQPADTVFMHQQLRGAVEFRLVPSLLPACHIVPVDSLWALVARLGKARRFEAFPQLLKQYHVRSVYYLSMPVFSRDRQTAIIDINETCYGLCGGGATYVVRKTNSQWRILRQLWRWAS